MVTWQQRFEDLVFEVNGLPLPSLIRQLELEKVVHGQLYDDLQDMYKQVAAGGFTPDTILMTEELWSQIVNDPLFGDTVVEETSDEEL